MRTSREQNRTNLGFADAVVDAFRFLGTKYDFSLVEVGPTLVRYESPELFIRLYHGRASFELGFEVGRIDRCNNEEIAFSIGDILDLVGVREESGYTFFQASTPERVKRLVKRLAAIVEKYAGPVLKNSTGIFDLLSQTQSRKSDQLLKKWHLSNVRERAERAWRKRNYHELASLLESIREDLSPAEAKKLEYAKKKLLLSKFDEGS